MKQRVYLVLIGIGCVAQFGVLGAMIMRRELALKHGAVCRFRTAPVDPYDAFRGKYVALDIEGDREGLLTEKRYEHNQRVYVRIGTDTNGFSVIEDVAVKPDATALWIKARVNYSYEKYDTVTNTLAALSLPGQGAEIRQVPTGKFQTHLALPFDRYYMDEKLAPEAESAYREASRREQRKAVVTVRVWRGVTVIEQLEIDGQPIHDIARERLLKK
ncbi:MAG: GDYXXLXY domain-containing protein [bacterium]